MNNGTRGAQNGEPLEGKVSFSIGVAHSWGGAVGVLTDSWLGEAPPGLDV